MVDAAGARGRLDGSLVQGIVGFNVPLGPVFVGAEGNVAKGISGDIDWQYGGTGRAGVRAGDSGYLAAYLEPGMRAMAIGVTVETAAGGFILPGDRVDVVLTHQVRVNGEARDAGAQNAPRDAAGAARMVVPPAMPNSKPAAIAPASSNTGRPRRGPPAPTRAKLARARYTPESEFMAYGEGVMDELDQTFKGVKA